MSMTLKQKERAVERAVKRLDQAAEALADLSSIAIEHGVDMSREERFRDELRERANHWSKCTWWRKDR